MMSTTSPTAAETTILREFITSDCLVRLKAKHHWFQTSSRLLAGAPPAYSSRSSSAVSLAWYVCIMWQACVPFKDAEKWVNRNLTKFNKKNATSSTWGGITSCTSTCSRPRWSLVIQSDRGRWSLSSTQHWSHLACWVQFQASLCKSPAKQHTRMIKGLEYLTYQ